MLQTKLLALVGHGRLLTTRMLEKVITLIYLIQIEVHAQLQAAHRRLALATIQAEQQLTTKAH